MIRNQYETLGVEEFYKQNGGKYRNPHELIISKLVKKAISDNLIGESVLDLCCGSGEITTLMGSRNTVGLDPYTSEAYEKRTGKSCVNLNFIQIANGDLQKELSNMNIDEFDTVICSFALHLCPPSLLHSVLWQLKDVSSSLIVISPNKKPNCDNVSGWKKNAFFEIDRVKLTAYQTNPQTF